MERDSNDVALKEIVAWFTSYQNNTTQLVHYTEGLRGCGNFLEERLRSAFFNILTRFSQKLQTTKDVDKARSLLHSFDCKFLARDFQAL